MTTRKPGAGRRVALFRGINVGRAKRIAMADLREIVAGLGYGDVRSLLNSGNIIFTAEPGAGGDAAIDIERAVASRLGITSRVIVLTAAELDAIVADNPLHDVADNPSRLMVFVPANPSDRSKLKALTAQTWTPEVLAIGRRVAYLWCPVGIIDSPLAAAVGRLLGTAVTARNWATVTKLHALVNASPP